MAMESEPMVVGDDVGGDAVGLHVDAVSVTGGGKLFRVKAWRGHHLEIKSSRRTRRYAGKAIVDGTSEEHVLKNGEHIADTFVRAEVPLSKDAGDFTRRGQVRYFALNLSKKAQLAKIVLEEKPLLYIYHRRILIAHTTKLDGYKQMPDGLVRVVGLKLK